MCQSVLLNYCCYQRFTLLISHMEYFKGQNLENFIIFFEVLMILIQTLEPKTKYQLCKKPNLSLTSKSCVWKAWNMLVYA
jgi:hypothetical protein